MLNQTFVEMKKFNYLSVVFVVVLSAGLMLSGCKKKTETIVPAFIVTATTVQLQTGEDGLQFFGKCTNDDVKMTKVIITDPFLQDMIFNVNGNYFVKGEAFAMQGANEAYLKQSGTWKFTFIGNRTADGASFSVAATLLIAK